MNAGAKLFTWTTFTLLAGVSLSPAANTTECASVALSGAPSNGVSYQTALSSNGRYAAFLSTGTNLVSTPHNGFQQIYIRNLATRATRCASLSNAGALADRGCLYPTVSGDGRYVAFATDATNLIDSDTNSTTDIYVRDIQAGTTVRASVGAGGVQSQGFSTLPAISANGRYVAFQSGAANLVTGVSGIQIYVRDLQTGTTSLVSASSAGTKGNGSSGNPAISADGRYIAFDSDSTNLVTGDANGYIDVFVKDMATGVTVRASRTSSGGEGNWRSYNPSISSDGKIVAFTSESTNVVPFDFNNSPDAFVFDVVSGAVNCISVTGSGVPAGNGSAAPSVNSDGRYVAFESDAGDISGGTDGLWKVFVRDRVASTTTLASFGIAGATPNLESYDPWISGDGRYVGYESGASNIVPNDGNNASDVFVWGPKRPTLSPVAPGGF